MNSHRILHATSYVLLMLAFWPVNSALAEHDHTGYFPDGYQDARTCIMCHKNATTEVMGSVHYLWRTENAQVEFPGGGAHGMIDRACGLVGSSAMINYGEQCGRCHIANSLPFPDPMTGAYTFDQKASVDCLICHAAAGQYDCNGDGAAQPGEHADSRPRVQDPATGRMVWWQDRSQRAAESVGKRVSADACLRCHHHGQADYQYKRGTPFEPETDVHAAAGVHCTDCHTTQHHKIARGNRVTDMFANELPQVDVKCENCHGAAPHGDARLNAHTSRIGCETCHIPELAGAQRRIWAPAFGMTEGPESQVPIFNKSTGKWEPYSVYDSGMVSPAYRWFNGGASMLAEPVAQPGAFNMQPATRATVGAKILPFRKFISGQPMDARGIPGMPNFNANFTMKSALEQMAPAMKMMGMMRPEGLTTQEAAMMSQFPNMLYFDRTEYFASGNVSNAISIGMAKLGFLMQGQDPSSMPRDYLLQAGAQMWSGQVAGLDLPDNPHAPGYEQDQDSTTATGSYITVSHAIKKVGALSCRDCHVPNGRLDFSALGYSPERKAVLESIYKSKAETWALYQ